MSTINDGIHLLSGVAACTVTVGWGDEKTDAIALVIDGTTYVAYEDPDDGYRSCGSFYPCNLKVDNHFPAQRVIAENIVWEGEDPDGWPSSGSYLRLTDCITNEVVLEVGTDTSDTYYPMAIFRWHPENLAINR